LAYGIRVNNLVKLYQNTANPAVKGVSFEVKKGEFFGFLGPNGAGKSTTIKILTTLMPKSSGSVSIGNLDLDKEPQKIRSLIGVQSQETALDLDLTARENLLLQGHLQHMGGQELQRRVDEILTLVALQEVANKRAASYSGGMKKRLDLATSLIHNPEILFLDEPTTGLDPQSRAAVWSYLKRLNKQQGITIFLTTQYLEEADKLCDRLAIIDHGQIVAEGSPAELKRQIGADAVSLTIEQNEEYDYSQDIISGNIKNIHSQDEAVDIAKHVLSRISGVSEVIESDNNNNMLTVYGKNGAAMVPEIVRILDNAQVRISSINVSTPTLDDVFLKHTGRRIRIEGEEEQQHHRNQHQHQQQQQIIKQDKGTAAAAAIQHQRKKRSFNFGKSKEQTDEGASTK
jgi:ABC-2 type transport system ATP-binding protein